MTEPSAPPIPDELRPYLDTIADRLLSRHAAVMIGSGFSKNAASAGSSPGFPDWSQLGDRFYQRLHGHPPGRDEKYLHVPALAHQVEAALGRPTLDQMLRDAIPDLQHEPSPLHAALLTLPWSDVFTTNYDTLLERARRSVISRRYDVVQKPDDLGHSNPPRIVKLHGSLPSERPFIITDEDYRRYPDDFAPFVNAVRQALLEDTLCLIGFSGDDPNFLQWIGWIQDNLGHRNPPKMYLVGLLDLSPSQKTLLQRRNITPLDMSVCPGITNHYQAIERFLRYLQSRRAADNQLDWPPHDTHESGNAPSPADLVPLWKSHRHRYPGWVILPQDLRLALWHGTLASLEELPEPDTVPPAIDLQFAFELTWRMEKCLCPIFDNQLPFLEATIARYWPVTESEPSTDSLPLHPSDMASQGLTLDAIRTKSHHILLALMRYYREEGLSTKWNDASQNVLSVLATLSPDHAAQFHYERALFALFTPDIAQLKTRLVEWPQNNSLPFWAAKKAALLAEIGQVGEAQRILEQSLDTIRTKLNLTPTKADYTLVSQESFVMYLLHAVRQGSLLTELTQSNTQSQRHEFRERWHVLKQYKCDPWQEIEIFEHKLQRPPAIPSAVAEKSTFDIGRLVQTSYMGGWNTEALAAYNFLRFCEDAGIPFRVPGCAIAAKSAAGTLARIAEYSSHWALATLVRLGEAKAVSEIFDRTSLARMDVSTIDGLIEKHLQSLRSALPDIETGDRWRRPNLGTLLAGVLPEMLSRLCCKCSQPAREQLLDWLLEVYRSDHRTNYQGVQVLVRRLIDVSPLRERVAMVPRLLQFPVLPDLDRIEEREYEHPFAVFRSPKTPFASEVDIAGISLEAFFAGATSDQPAVRRWAISALAVLHDMGLLEPALTQRFAEVLWSQIDQYGLPSGTNYYRFAFLSLPRPTGVDPPELFMQYVRGAQFPAQKDQQQTTIELGTSDDVALCHDIVAASVVWSKEDLRSITERLVQWWDTDKAHVLRVRVTGPFRSIAVDLGRRLSSLVRTLAKMVMKYMESINGELRGSVMRVVEECSQYDVPALRLDVACAYAFAASRDSVFQRVEDALASPRRETVIDALEAMDIVSQRPGSESDRDDLMRLLAAAGQMIRWRRATALWAALDAVGDVVSRHPWTFAGEVERSVLAGLGSLVPETAIGGEDRKGHGPEMGNHNLSRKLVVRRAAARLAYRLFEHYQAQGVTIPQAIEAWRAVCRSDAEFLDIRNEWLAP